MNRALLLYNALRKFPRVDIGIFPTPIQQLHNLEKRVGHSPLWIKRDDLTGLAFGGNKTRNLEFLLGDAVSKNCDTIIVPGPIQSNLCCITAAAANKLGLRCIQIFNDEKPTEITGNSTLNYLLGADSRYIGKVDLDTQAKYMENLASNLKAKGERPYVVYNGASTPLGALGYVKAALEIYEQVLKSKANMESIVISAGYGGTAAGLIYGIGVLGIPFKVHVISVEFDKQTLRSIFQNFMLELERLLGLSFDCSIDDVAVIYDDYMGEGWGCSTKESEKMVHLFPQKEGIFVEKVYTSKPLVGMMDLLSKKAFASREGVCYWHTGGLPALFAQVKQC